MDDTYVINIRGLENKHQVTVMSKCPEVRTVVVSHLADNANGKYHALHRDLFESSPRNK